MQVAREPEAQRTLVDIGARDHLSPISEPGDERISEVKGDEAVLVAGNEGVIARIMGAFADRRARRELARSEVPNHYRTVTADS
jgi:hypothetical protein